MAFPIINAIIIEPDNKKFEEVRKILVSGSLTKARIVIINILCLNNQYLFLKIKKLINNQNYLKIFHGTNEEIFNGMVVSLSLEDRKDIVYESDRLEGGKLKDVYQKYVFKPFPATLSSNLSLGREEI